MVAGFAAGAGAAVVARPQGTWLPPTCGRAARLLPARCAWSIDAVDDLGACGIGRRNARGATADRSLAARLSRSPHPADPHDRDRPRDRARLVRQAGAARHAELSALRHRLDDATL